MTRDEWFDSAKDALARVEFRNGARRAFGSPVVEMVPGATTYIAREDDVTGAVTFTRYTWDPRMPTWAKPLATERLATEPSGVTWKPCLGAPVELLP